VINKNASAIELALKKIHAKETITKVRAILK
jgi:hypothetical protein